MLCLDVKEEEKAWVQPPPDSSQASKSERESLT